VSQKGNEGVPSRVLNELFSQRLEVCEGKEKIAEYGGDYIRDRLREVAFAPRPPWYKRLWRRIRMFFRRSRGVDHDTLVKIVDVEPKSRAMAITFRGQPTKGFIRAERAKVPFFTGEDDATEDE
jgi:hypothetical protein